MKISSRIQIRRPLVPAFSVMAALFSQFTLSSASGTTLTFTTPGTTTWTCPAGVTSISVAVQGGGGGGGGGGTASGGRGGGGGGGACAFNPTVTVEPGVTYSIVVGAGGTAGPATTGTGGTGGASSFSGGLVTTLTANGGAGGALGGGSSNGAATAAGTATGGTVNFSGGTGGGSRMSTTGGGGGGGAGTTGAGGNASGTNGVTPGIGGTGSPAGGAGSGNGGTVGGGSTGGAPGGGGAGAYRGSTSQAGYAGGRGQVTLVYTAAPNFKANNTLALNDPASWTAYLPIGSVAEWNSTVTAANTTSLGADLTFGGIRISDPGGLVTVNAGNTLTLGSEAIDLDLATATQDLTLNCNLAMNGANVWDVASGRTLTLGGAVTGAFAITKQGSGTAVLSGANAWTGATTVSAGTLKLGASSVIPDGSGTGNVSLTGTLDLNGFNEGLNGLGGAGTVDNTAAGTSSLLTVGANAQSSTFSGSLQNSGASSSLGLVKTGSGTLTLSGVSSYSGITTINSGAINIQNAGALGSTVAGVEVNGGGTGSASNARLELQGGVTVTGESVTLKGIGNFLGALSSAVGSNVWAGNVTIGASGTRLGASSSATLKVSGVIDSGSNAYGLNLRTSDLTGIVVLSGVNTYLGDTTLFIGKVQLEGGDNRLPVATKLILGSGSTSNAEFDLNGVNQEVAGLALGSGASAANNAINNSSATASVLTVRTAAATASSFAGIVKGNLALSKSGAGSLTLGAANTYSGATNVNAGTLLFSTAGSGASDVSVATAAAAGTVVAAADGQFISTGDLSLANGSTLTIDYGSSPPSTTTAPLKVDNLLVGTGLGLLLQGNTLPALSVGQTYPLVTWTTSGPSDASAFTTILTHRLQGTFSVSGSTLSLTVTANSAGTPISWNSGSGTWDTVSSNWLDATLATTTYFDNLDAVLFGDASGASGNPVITLNTALSPTGVTLNSTAHDYTLSGTGAIAGSGSLTLSATNTRTLTILNANTYTGATVVNGGTLRLGNGGTDGSLAAASAISVGTGATLAVNQSDTVTQGTDFGSAAISGAGGLAQSGSGTTLLNAVNTYTGPTSIAAGVLQIAGSGQLGGGTYPGDIAISGGAGFQYASSAAQTLSGVLSGSGAFTTSSGVLTLTGANTHTGTTTVGGTLILGNAAALSTTTAITLGNGSKLQPNLGGAVVNAPIALGGSGTTATIEAPNLNPGNQTPVVLTLNGAISGSGDVTFSCSPDSNTINTVLLNAQSNFSGTTSITRSATSTTATQTIVKLGINNALPVTTVVNIDGGDGSGSGRGTEINLNGFSQELAGLTNTQRATTRRQRIVNSDVAAAAVLTINNPADCTFTGYLGGNGFSVSASATPGSSNGDNFSLVKSGPGKFTLGVGTGAGGLSYKGNTTVNAGTLSLGRTNAGNDLSTVSIASAATLELTFPGTDTVDKLFIGGTQLAAGEYGAVGSASPVIGVSQITGSGTLTVTSGPVVAGYSSWITGSFANGTVPAGKQGPNDDADGDGISNLVEYAIDGQDPTVPNTAIGTYNGTTLAFTKRSGTAGLTYAIQESTDLGVSDAWAEVPAGPAYTNSASSISFTLPGGPSKDFLRLLVQSN